MKLEMPVNTQRIALWGAPGSGKSWLANALGRSLMNFRQDDPDFSYELREYSDEKFAPFVTPIAPPIYQPTNDLADFMWLFRRKAKQKTFAHNISSNTHILHIYDINGLESVRLTDRVKQNYTDVQLILLTLDPVMLNKDGKKTVNKEVGNSDGQTGSNEHSIMTRELYLLSIKRLLDYIGETNNKHPLIAVCVTKQDLWKEDIPAEMAIKHWFGQQMFDLFIQYSGEFKIKTFIMTSCGWLDDDARKPNYNKITGKLLNVSQWKPRGVINPFFWFLDNREREMLLPKKNLFRSFLERNPLRHFISYPTVD